MGEEGYREGRERRKGEDNTTLKSTPGMDRLNNPKSNIGKSKAGALPSAPRRELADI